MSRNLLSLSQTTRDFLSRREIFKTLVNGEEEGGSGNTFELPGEKLHRCALGRSNIEKEEEGSEVHNEGDLRYIRGRSLRHTGRTGLRDPRRKSTQDTRNCLCTNTLLCLGSHYIFAFSSFTSGTSLSSAMCPQANCTYLLLLSMRYWPLRLQTTMPYHMYGAIRVH